MYFEDIFEEIRPLLKEVYYLGNAIEVEYKCEGCFVYNFPEINENLDKAEYIVEDSPQSKNYSEWARDLIFPLEKALISFAHERYVFKKQKEIYLVEIPLTFIEKFYRNEYRVDDHCLAAIPEADWKAYYEMWEEYKGLRFRGY